MMLAYAESDVQGPDGGVLPLEGVKTQYSPATINSISDPTENYNQYDDTGASSFSGTDPQTYTYFPVRSGDLGRGGDGGENLVAEIVVTATKNGQEIQMTTVNIQNSYGVTYLDEIAVSYQGGDQTSVDPIVVTAHRYNPCGDGLSLTMSNISSHSSEAPHDDTMGAFTSVAYQIDEVNPVVPAGYVLQDKYVSPDDGSFIFVMQRANSNDYLFVARGSNSVGAFINDAQLFLTPSVATEMMDVKNWAAGVLTTIRNFDPTAHIYISGHSLGGSQAIVMGAEAIALGFSTSQVQVTALAPWASTNALAAAGLSGFASAVAPSVDSYWHTDDPTFMFRGNGVGNIIKTTPSDAIVIFGKTLALSTSGHSSCRYVSQM